MRSRNCALFVALLLLPAAGRADTFEFHNGFWINLHHFLYEQALAQGATPPGPQDWREAVNYYRSEVVKQDLLSDEAGQINDRLANLEDAKSIADAGLPADLAAILNAAAPVYRAQWWPAHDRANRAWIEAAKPLITKYDEALKKELAAAFQTDWPAEPVRVDVTEYANWAGAYTTLGPMHITISSVDPGNQGDAALEILFHEASHALVGKTRAALADALVSQNRLFRTRNFWHALLFYTAGEFARRHLEDYTPYAVKNGLYDRAWPGAQEVLQKDWQPYLDGKIDRQTAIGRLVSDYGVAR